MLMTDFEYDPSYKVDLLLTGDFAYFACPVGGAERSTYKYPVLGQLRGAVRSIFWKPEIEWVVRSVSILNEIQQTAYVTNELKAAVGSVTKSTKPICVDENRTQRQNHVLFDVAYKVVVSPLLVGNGCSETPDKYVSQLRRRIENGECYRTPHFGRIRYRADFGTCKGDETPIPLTRDVRMLLGWDQRPKKKVGRVADLEIRDGVITYDFEHHKMLSKYFDA